MKREWKPVPGFLREHREPFQTVNPVRARASCFIPGSGSRLLIIFLLPPTLVHLLREEGSVGAGEDKEFNSHCKSERPLSDSICFIK